MFTNLKRDIRAKFCPFAVPNMFFLLACHSLGILLIWAFETAVLHPFLPLFLYTRLEFCPCFAKRPPWNLPHFISGLSFVTTWVSYQRVFVSGCGNGYLSDRHLSCDYCFGKIGAMENANLPFQPRICSLVFEQFKSGLLNEVKASLKFSVYIHKHIKSLDKRSELPIGEVS